MSLVAAVALAGALALIGPAPLAPVRWRVPQWLPGLALAVVVALVAPRFLALSLIGGFAGWGGWRLFRQRIERREAVVTSGRVLDVCELLAAELSAGQPPGAALARSADEWPPLQPVAAAFRVGSDVPSALRELSDSPGAANLRLVAAAWQVAHRTGTGLTDALTRVAGQLRSDAATRRVVQGELASARATARLVAGLPVLALAMGASAGGDPIGFLLGEPLGWACLAGGLGFGLAGLAWIEAIAREVEAG